MVLLGTHTSVKEDVGCCTVELVYGTTLWMPRELFHQVEETLCKPSFIRIQAIHQFLNLPQQSCHQISAQSLCSLLSSRCPSLLYANNYILTFLLIKIPYSIQIILDFFRNIVHTVSDSNWSFQQEASILMTHYVNVAFTQYFIEKSTIKTSVNAHIKYEAFSSERK